MIARNANRFCHFAASCSALLLSGVLAAQTADAPQPRKDHDERYLDHDAAAASASEPGRAQPQQAQPQQAQPQQSKDQDQLPPIDGGAKQPMDIDVVEERAAVQAGKDSDSLPAIDGEAGKKPWDSDADDQRTGTLEPVPQLFAPELSLQFDDAGVLLKLQQEGGRAFFGAVLASTNDELVKYAANLRPILGRPAIVVAGIADLQLKGYLRDPGYDWLEVFVQGVTATEEGVQATGVQRVGFQARR